MLSEITIKLIAACAGNTSLEAILFKKSIVNADIDGTCPALGSAQGAQLAKCIDVARRRCTMKLLLAWRSGASRPGRAQHRLFNEMHYCTTCQETNHE
jgi:hypothetical protein